MKRRIAFGLLLLVCASVIAGAFFASRGRVESGVTPANFLWLRQGMSRSQVCGLLGRPHVTAVVTSSVGGLESVEGWVWYKGEREAGNERVLLAFHLGPAYPDGSLQRGEMFLDDGTALSVRQRPPLYERLRAWLGL